jgi:hypothetical protein
VTERIPLARPRPRSLRSGAFFVVAAVSLLRPGAGAAQEPDTVPAPPVVEVDTAAAPVDTIAPLPPALPVLGQDTVPEDTLGPPPPALPAMDPVGPASFARGVWEWDRDALRRLPDFSVLQLLERLPGVVPLRADIINQPEGATIFGSTAGAIRYVVDGFELDPLSGPTFDPSRFPLLALESVRVERRVTGITVRLRTLSPDDPRPRSIIEAGTGDLDVNLFRGMFLAPRVLGGPLALGFERLASDGRLPEGSSNHVGGWLKWTWVRERTGIQIEYRQGDMDRGGIGEGLLGARRDWVVRARTGLGPLVAEVYGGASRVEDDLGDVVLREGTPHGGLRLRGSVDGPVPLEARSAFRFRDNPRLPSGEVELELRAEPLPFLAVEGEGVYGWWKNGAATGRWAGRAQAGPVLGLTVFGELFGGAPPFDRGSEVLMPGAEASTLRISRDGVRAGAELHWGGLMLGGAALRTTLDTIPGFGLPFEPEGLGVAGAEADGFEVVARLPTGVDPISLQGWYVGMRPPDSSLYLPEHQWRAAVVYHHLPLESGNLEIFVRVEHVFRGRMTGPALAITGDAGEVEPDPEPTPGLPALTEVPAFRTTNLELSIRVVSVRAFLRWENLMHRLELRDLDGYILPGQRVTYGVKWEFLN